MKHYSISEASAKLTIPESTIRYYEKKGLLPLIERDEAGRRLFSDDQIMFLQIIIYLKNTNMPISRIKQYVDWVVEGDGTIDLRLDLFIKHKQTVLDDMALMTEALKAMDKKIERYTNRIQSSKQGKEEK
ncbi:MerR family transcriptional regulator [Paenibacillus paridis]|uniref:MerR family transcriptional regulator n=1 Tax=Paenibacillus paridis TaxID=2583376 RepID=UPI00111FC90B|nr:MerR family transcriptional regulator [Paenibacillus paridis]